VGQQNVQEGLTGVCVIVCFDPYCAAKNAECLKSSSVSPISKIPIEASDLFVSVGSVSHNNGNLVGIYILLINCTNFIHTSLHFVT